MVCQLHRGGARPISHLRPTVDHHGALSKVHVCGRPQATGTAAFRLAMSNAHSLDPTWFCLPMPIATGTVEASPSEPTAPGGFRLGTKQRPPSHICGCRPALHMHYCARHCPACLRQGPRRPAPASASGSPLASVPVPVLLQVALRHCRITPRNTMTHLPSQLGCCPFCTNPLLHMPTST